MDSSKALSHVQIANMVDKTTLSVHFEAKTSKRITIGDIGNILMTQMKINKDEVLGITKYFFGQTKGFVKIKMVKPNLDFLKEHFEFN